VTDFIIRYMCRSFLAGMVKKL